MKSLAVGRHLGSLLATTLFAIIFVILIYFRALPPLFICPSFTFLILSNSSLSLVRLGVDFVLPLSQQEQEQQDAPTKISAVTDRILMKL